MHTLQYDYITVWYFFRNMPDDYATRPSRFYHHSNRKFIQRDLFSLDAWTKVLQFSAPRFCCTREILLWRQVDFQGSNTWAWRRWENVCFWALTLRETLLRTVIEDKPYQIDMPQADSHRSILRNKEENYTVVPLGRRIRKWSEQEIHNTWQKIIKSFSMVSKN